MGSGEPLRVARVRAPEHAKPGLGAAYWAAEKAKAERNMAGIDTLPDDLRAVVYAAGNLRDACRLFCAGFREHREIEDFIASKKPIPHEGPGYLIPEAPAPRGGLTRTSRR